MITLQPWADAEAMVNTILRAIDNYMKYKRALNDVRKLDSRMLSDIGLVGADLEEALKPKDASKRLSR